MDIDSEADSWHEILENFTNLVFVHLYINTERILASFHHACGSLVSCIRKTNDFRNNPKY